MTNTVQIIILAAGKGTRMKSELPKVLIPLHGTPIIKHLLNTIESIENKPFSTPYIVVGHGKEEVMAALGTQDNYVEQKEQLGTGDAINSVKNSISDIAPNTLILYGDHPFVSAATIEKIINKKLESGKKIVMATVALPDFEDWRKNFLGFSRVERDGNGKILRTIENKDATPEEKKITEVNPCYFCIDTKFLWEEIAKLKNDNAQHEYYLTDVFKIAVQEGVEIESIQIGAHEALGANSKEELETLETLKEKA